MPPRAGRSAAERPRDRRHQRGAQAGARAARCVAPIAIGGLRRRGCVGTHGRFRAVTARLGARAGCRGAPIAPTRPAAAGSQFARTAAARTTIAGSAIATRRPVAGTHAASARASAASRRAAGGWGTAPVRPATGDPARRTNRPGVPPARGRRCCLRRSRPARRPPRESPEPPRPPRGWPRPPRGPRSSRSSRSDPPREPRRGRVHVEVGRRPARQLALEQAFDVVQHAALVGADQRQGLAAGTCPRPM